jgi:Divergent InlB B-repeat domain/Protein of unknown function (DUF1573)
MRISPQSIRDLLLCTGGHLLLLVTGLVDMGKLQAQEPIYGSGDFILNDGPVVSDTGTIIGGTETDGWTGGTTPLIDNYPTWLTILPASDDGLPHSIKASAVNGSVARFPDQEEYDFNTWVTLTATPDPGYVFEKWTLEYGTIPFALNEQISIQTQKVDLRGPTIRLKAVFNYEMVAHFIPATRIISVSAVDLSWDKQAVGGTSAGTFKISNTGNAPLTVASIDYPVGFNGSWEGSIAPGSSQEITVNFAPTAAGSFSGNITVHSDATSGAFTLPIVAVAHQTYTLTGTSSFGDLKTSPATRTYWWGSIVTLKAMPVAGYVFMNWTEGRKILSTDANFDLKITRQHQVWANYLPVSRTLKVSISKSLGLNKAGTIYRGKISIKNTGTAPVYLSKLRLESKGTGPIWFDAYWFRWIEPGSTVSAQISFFPSLANSYRIRVFPVAKDLTSPAKWLELRR